VRALAARAVSTPRVAVLERRGKFLVAEPFFGRGPRLVISKDRRTTVGDLVLLRGCADGAGRRGGRVTVTRRIGRADVARDVIEALMLDRGLRRSFDPAVDHEARSAAADPAGSAQGRRDLRSLPTFTIDPATARDHDDALSARREDGGRIRAWVHIADVSAVVPSCSPIDREAYRRGTSVYVPCTVEPMLPEALSADACSLLPGEDRLAVTVEMVLEDGEVVSTAFHRTVIRSDQRLDYDRVERIFAGAERAEAPWGEALAAARAAAAQLSARRARRGALALEAPEPEFSFDREGNVLGARLPRQTESHRLVEHLMIAANEQVAALLEARGVPTLYRVHERPDGLAVERLIEQLVSLEVPTPPVPRGPMTPQQAAEVAGEVSQLVERWLGSPRGRGRRALTSLVLRSLKQAHYDHRNLGHAGLQSARYCHFTSPIRRYPDLVCHRALLSVIGGAEPAPEAAFVAGAGPWSSTREREAMAVERDADDVARCFLLERELWEGDPDREFEGEVVGLVGSGAFVAFGEDGMFEGMLPVRRMSGDWWELNEEGTMLVGAHSGRRIRLGDPVTVRVGGVDPPRGRVDLLPAQSGEPWGA
jgi:ribonuclease R